MRCLITGITGFLGPHLAKLLINNGADEHQIYGLLRGTRGSEQEIKDLFCLLYTSPSPRDRQKSRMPSSA